MKTLTLQQKEWFWENKKYFRDNIPMPQQEILEALKFNIRLQLWARKYAVKFYNAQSAIKNSKKL